MRRWVGIGEALAASVVLAALSGGIAGAQPAAAGPAAVRRHLETVYRREGAVIETRDPKTVRRFYDALLTPDFTDRARGIVLRRAEFVDIMEQNAREVKSIHLTLTPERVTVQGTTATALVRHRANGVLSDHRGAKHTFAEVFLYRHTWTKPGDRWLLKRRELVRQELSLLDGKPAP